MEYSELKQKKCIVFDLDGTLALSKQSINSEMTVILSKLLETKLVAVVSGGKVFQIKSQVAAKLPIETRLSNLHLFPTNGSAYYHFEAGQWQKVYEEVLTDAEKMQIRNAFGSVKKTSPGLIPEQTYGEQLEDRQTQVTFSALGQQAPLFEKEIWDPDMKKREAIKAIIEPLLPNFFVRLGGTTSIDVTRQGIDKAYAIRKICLNLNLTITDILFVGDAIYPGGNDFAATETGVDYKKVTNVDETKKIIKIITS